jgi:hypothetical protein
VAPRISWALNGGSRSIFIHANFASSCDQDHLSVGQVTRPRMRSAPWRSLYGFKTLQRGLSYSRRIFRDEQTTQPTHAPAATTSIEFRLAFGTWYCLNERKFGRDAVRILSE